MYLIRQFDSALSTHIGLKFKKIEILVHLTFKFS